MRQRSVSSVAIWALLCLCTLLSMTLVEGRWFGSAASILIVLIAALKSRLVIIHFMEASRAARHWRFLYETWNFTVTAMIIIGYVMGIKR